jgi:hypothetical protein
MDDLLQLPIHVHLPSLGQKQDTTKYQRLDSGHTTSLGLFNFQRARGACLKAESIL